MNTNNQPQTNELLTSFYNFLEASSAERLNRNLGKLIINYIPYNRDSNTSDFEEFLIDIEMLMNLLSLVDLETKKPD